MKIIKFFKIKHLKKENGEIVTLTLIALALVTTAIAVGGLTGQTGMQGLANVFFGTIMGIIQNIVAAFLNFSYAFFRVAVYSGFPIGETLPKEGTLYEEVVNTLRNTQAFKDIWGSVRDFANMFIALGFVICGIGTALRIQEYEARKTLVPLILIAILVNFTYHLWFGIFDICNGVTKKFITASPLSGVPASVIAGSVWSGTVKVSTMSFIIKGAMSIFMTLLWATTYFTYGLVFILRFAAVPILIIFSPLALVSLAFEATKGVWDKWFSQYLTWCLIGIIGGISIYTANVFMVKDKGGMAIGENIIKTNFLDKIDDQEIKLSLEPLKTMLPLGALMFGLFLSGAGSAVMAGTIMSGTAAVASTAIAAGAGGAQRIAGAFAGAAGTGAGAPAAAPGYEMKGAITPSAAPPAPKPTLYGPTGTPLSPTAPPPTGAAAFKAKITPMPAEPKTLGNRLMAGGTEAIRQFANVGGGIATGAVRDAGGLVRGTAEKVGGIGG